MLVIKKYSNRRLYDTAESRYITLEELAAKIKAGAEIQVQDAKTGQDLTQATLVQIIMESRGASRLLPTPLLVQMIRMGDDTLAEFLGQYMSMALQLYLQARKGAAAVSPYYPFASAPFAAADALARFLGGGAPWGRPAGPAWSPWGRAASPQAGPPDPAAWGAPPGWPPPEEPPEDEPSPATAPPQSAPARDDIAALRQELEALKDALLKGQKGA